MTSFTHGWLTEKPASNDGSDVTLPFKRNSLKQGFKMGCFRKLIVTVACISYGNCDQTFRTPVMLLGLLLVLFLVCSKLKHSLRFQQTAADLDL